MTYTQEELDQFDKLTRRAVDQNQSVRGAALLDLNRFRRQHGPEKCGAMTMELIQREGGERRAG